MAMCPLAGVMNEVLMLGFWRWSVGYLKISDEEEVGRSKTRQLCA
ncbi:hypothetical protein NPX99_05260 [Bartonella sp. 220]|nr:hypothetical protein [Bartonella sp. 220B]MCZ2158683.1 hypothetical protein [Bartonella sp. 220B]